MSACVLVVTVGHIYIKAVVALVVVVEVTTAVFTVTIMAAIVAILHANKVCTATAMALKSCVMAKPNWKVKFYVAMATDPNKVACHAMMEYAKTFAMVCNNTKPPAEMFCFNDCFNCCTC